MQNRVLWGTLSSRPSTAGAWGAHRAAAPAWAVWGSPARTFLQSRLKGDLLAPFSGLDRLVTELGTEFWETCGLPLGVLLLRSEFLFHQSLFKTHTHARIPLHG